KSDMEEGDYLPVEINELKSLLNALNSWNPGEKNKDTLLFPPGFQHILQKLRYTKRFKDVSHSLNNKVDEPVLLSESGQKTLFGFLDMSNSDAYGDIKSETPLFTECPGQCSEVERKWICSYCGDFVSVKFAGDITLFCSCG